MSKQVTRTCDQCPATATMGDDQAFVNAGWTELRYTFGSSINAYNAKSIQKDLCPKCAETFGMIKLIARNQGVYADRPERREEVAAKEPDILEVLREAIVQIGSEEGWYKNE